jgi:hypothetical protein
MFKLYDLAKKEHPDIDEWLAASVYEELGDKADAVLAASTCENSDTPWEDPAVFEKIALVINERPVFSDLKQDISLKEIAYAVDVLKRRYPEDAFNDVICQYIAGVASEEGILVMPVQLSFVQRFLPVIKLTQDQETAQEAYLQEIEDYIAIRAMLETVKTTLA